MISGRLIVIFSLLLLSINGSAFTQAKRGEVYSYGVNVGDRFNLLVVEAPERPKASEEGEPPAGVNFTQLLNLNLDNFTLRPIIDPFIPVGTPISVNITHLPSNASLGTIRYNISQNYTEVETKFVLGEPIVSTDGRDGRK